MAKPFVRTDEVFGIVRGIPLNYVERERVDHAFYENMSRNKHIVIHGSSKQGKTSLRKTWLGESDYLHVGCLNTMTLSDLNSALLKKSGYAVQQSSTKTSSGTNKFAVEISVKGKIPFIAEGSGQGSAEHQKQLTDAVTVRRLEIDLNDVNDIVSALREANSPRFLVLEDFHYLPIETQSGFSMALKLYHEESDYCFIVIGVWRERNRLIYFNGDLASRVVAIDADDWQDADLSMVMTKGAELLNIEFEAEFARSVIDHAQSAVYLVQEACFKACQNEGVENTQDIRKVVGAGLDAADLIKSVVDEQAGRYTTFIQAVSEGFQPTELEMYKWLLRAVLDFTLPSLNEGIRRQEIATAIKEFHPNGESLNEGNITQALTNIASLQVKKGVRPIILDYDQTNRVLNVVDKAFLVWLSYQDRVALNEEIIS